MTDLPIEKNSKNPVGMAIKYPGSVWLNAASLSRRAGHMEIATKCAYEAEEYASEWGYIAQYDLAMTFRNLDIHHRAIYWLIIAARNGDPDAAKDINNLYGIDLKIQ